MKKEEAIDAAINFVVREIRQALGYRNEPVEFRLEYWFGNNIHVYFETVQQKRSINLHFIDLKAPPKGTPIQVRDNINDSWMYATSSGATSEHGYIITTSGCVYKYWVELAVVDNGANNAPE